ncbi:MAG: SRPBCC domain-containing protein [Saprospiraceae bacterium]
MEEINGTIYIKKVFKASIEEVWTAWTDPDRVMLWFGSDPQGSVLFATLDVKLGGCFKITFKDADLTEHTCSGKYLEVLEFNKLCFTWNWKSEPGVESYITIVFQAEGNSTHMQFEHDKTRTESKHAYYKGWLSTFSKLERMLNSGFDPGFL